MTAPPQASAVAQRLSLARLDVHGAAAWMMPFGLVTYLALKGGGYDPVVRGEVGVAASWILALGAAVGALPASRISRGGWTTLGVLALFGCWTLLGVTWSESAERSMAEAGRVAIYVAIFALALAARSRGRGRQVIAGVASGVALISILAVVSRLHPGWLGQSQTAEFLPGTAHRLSYPVNYWNGLAALVVMGIPAVLVVAWSARSLAARAIAAGVLPVMALTLFLTASRGGALGLGVALVAMLALSPARLAMFVSLLVGATGSAILVAAASQRPAVIDGAVTEVARRQGDELLAMALVVGGGVALLHVAVALAARHRAYPRWLDVPPRRARWVGVLAVAIAAVVFVAAGGPGHAAASWHTFKSVSVSNGDALNGGLFSRLQTSYGNGRYQYWQSAGRANDVRPLQGTGPGTFEYWWARDGSIGGFVRNAHSLYFETLAELGVVGLVLIAGFLLSVLGAGIARSLRGPPPARLHIAGATSGCLAFAVAALFDWVWQIAVLPVAFLLLASVIFRPPAAKSGRKRARSRRGAPLARSALVLLAVTTLVLTAIPLAAAVSIRRSQTAAAAGDTPRALAAARTAASIQPYAAAPHVQLALLMESAGDLRGASREAATATRREPTNWRNWLTLTRIEAKRGRAAAAIAAYRRARSLNPRSPLFPRVR